MERSTARERDEAAGDEEEAGELPSFLNEEGVETEIVTDGGDGDDTDDGVDE
ncbi:hypothetical protein [Haloarcula salina]|nr:hypothetical protein [Haloarcula salina]